MSEECSEAAPTHVLTRGTTWTQQGMLPPGEVSLRLEISVDGPAGFGTVSIIVHNDNGTELAALECAPVVPFDRVLAVATAMLNEQLATALSVLSPF